MSVQLALQHSVDEKPRQKGANILWREFQDRLIKTVLRTDHNFIVRGLLLPYRNSLLSGAQFVETDDRRFMKVLLGVLVITLIFLHGTIDAWRVGGSKFFGPFLFTIFLVFMMTTGITARLGFKRKSLVDSLVPDPHFKYNSSAAESAGFWAALGVAIYGVYKAFYLF